MNFLLKKQVNKKNQGFTLMEIMIVVVIIVIVAVIILVSLNPLKRFADARNAQRWSDAGSLSDAVRLYQLDNQGQLPATIDDNWRMISAAPANNCNISCGGSGVTNNFTDNSQATFNGTPLRTQWNSGSSWMELDATGRGMGNGAYTSLVKDGGASVTWSELSWIPQAPYYKELPNNSLSESLYPSGNINMSGNVLLMHLNEPAGSGTINDTSGNNNSGLNNGATCGATGKLNTALSFNGTNNYISIPDANSLDLTTNISVSAWVYANSYPLWATILGKTTSGSWANGYGLAHYTGTNDIHFWVTSYSSTNAVATVPTGGWHHIIGTYDGSIIKIYLDGVQQDSRPRTGAISTNNSALNIGCANSGAYFWNGRIDEVAVFNRALTATEVSDIYKRGALRLKFQIQSCDDSNCVGESFVGPNGTVSTFYSELNNSGLTPPVFTITNLPSNQYFRYQTIFETDDPTLSPDLKSVNIVDLRGGGEQVTLASDCVDFSFLSAKLPKIPTDPKEKDPVKTYYAIKKMSSGQILVMACKPEGEENIKVSK